MKINVKKIVTRKKLSRREATDGYGLGSDNRFNILEDNGANFSPQVKINEHQNKKCIDHEVLSIPLLL